MPVTKYQRRSERRAKARPYRVTERDGWLLDALARMRFLTTTQLLRLRFGSSRSAVNKRLRRLFDAGLVRVWVRCLESDNVYSLMPAGRAALSTEEGGNGVRVPRGLDRDLDHTLAINDVRIALATTLPAVDAELVSWRSDWDLRPRRSARLVPDARFAVRWSNGAEAAFNLEVDRNTKSASALLRKLLAYRAATYRHDHVLGSRDFLILVVAHNPAWLDRYRLQVSHAALRLPVWFAMLSDVVAHGAVAAVWRNAGSDHAHSLTALAALPNRSEGPAQKTAAAAGASAPAAARVAYPGAGR